jgi:hypothetical protein
VRFPRPRVDRGDKPGQKQLHGILSGTSDVEGRQVALEDPYRAEPGPEFVVALTSHAREDGMARAPSANERYVLAGASVREPTRPTPSGGVDAIELQLE